MNTGPNLANVQNALREISRTYHCNGSAPLHVIANLCKMAQAFQRTVQQLEQQNVDSDSIAELETIGGYLELLRMQYPMINQLAFNEKHKPCTKVCEGSLGFLCSHIAEKSKFHCSEQGLDDAIFIIATEFSGDRNNWTPNQTEAFAISAHWLAILHFDDRLSDQLRQSAGESFRKIPGFPVQDPRACPNFI